MANFLKRYMEALPQLETIEQAEDFFNQRLQEIREDINTSFGHARAIETSSLRWFISYEPVAKRAHYYKIFPFLQRSPIQQRPQTQRRPRQF